MHSSVTINAFVFSVLFLSSVKIVNMPAFFNVDHKMLAMTTLAATASLAVYSLYRLRTLKRKLAARDEDVYGTGVSLSEYLMSHYGSASEIMAFSFQPSRSDVDIPKRCSELCIKHTDLKVQQ